MIRTLKLALEDHPIYLIITFTFATIALLFLFVDLHDHMNWNIL